MDFSPVCPCSANQTVTSHECIGRNELFSRAWGANFGASEPYAYRTKARNDAFCGFLTTDGHYVLGRTRRHSPGGTDAAPDGHHAAAAQPRPDRTCGARAAVPPFGGAARDRAALLGHARGCRGRLSAWRRDPADQGAF